MSVYTKVSAAELDEWLRNYAVGDLVEAKGIAAGIENTNYFVTTLGGRYVLTIFERLTTDALAFYLALMSHLARHHIPCPSPVPDRHGALLGTLKAKPAALVTRLPGTAIMDPEAAHCAEVGALLAAMHLAGADFPGELENPRGPRWWRTVAPDVRPFLDA